MLVCCITVHLRRFEHGCFPLAYLYNQSTVRTFSKISFAKEWHFHAKVKGLWHWVLLIPNETEATRCFALPNGNHHPHQRWNTRITASGRQGGCAWACVCMHACMCVCACETKRRLGERFSITRYCLLSNKEENQNTAKLMMSCLTPLMHV